MKHMAVHFTFSNVAFVGLKFIELNKHHRMKIVVYYKFQVGKCGMIIGSD